MEKHYSLRNFNDKMAVKATEIHQNDEDSLLSSRVIDWNAQFSSRDLDRQVIQWNGLEEEGSGDNFQAIIDVNAGRRKKVARRAPVAQPSWVVDHGRASLLDCS